MEVQNCLVYLLHWKCHTFLIHSFRAYIFFMPLCLIMLYSKNFLFVVCDRFSFKQVDSWLQLYCGKFCSYLIFLWFTYCRQRSLANFGFDIVSTGTCLLYVTYVFVLSLDVSSDDIFIKIFSQNFIENFWHAIKKNVDDCLYLMYIIMYC